MELKHIRREIIPIILGILILIPLTLIFSRLNLNLDLTDNKIYSLSKITLNVINRFDQPLYIHWWKSEDFQSPQIDIIEDLFSDLSGKSDSEIFTEIKIPQDSDKNRLKSIGLLEQQLEVPDGTEITQKLIFSGIEIKYLNSTVTIPFIAEPENMEFQLLEAFNRLENGKKKTVAIFPDYSDEKPNGIYTLLSSQLTQYFNVWSVSDNNPLTQIPDIMIVPDRKEFSMEELFAIDQTIQSGNPVIFLIDGLDINPMEKDYAIPFDDYSLINRLLNAYGISIGDALISDKNSLYFNYMAGQTQRYNQYDMWFKPDETIDLLWAFPLQITPVEEIEYNVRKESSSVSWLNEGETGIEPDISKDSPDFTGPYPVIIELIGNFKPVFQTSAQLNSSTGTILVIGSTLTFSDFMQSSGSLKNINYLRNSIYRLLGNNELYQIALSSGQGNLMNSETLLTGRGQNYVIVVNLLMVPLFIIIMYFILLYIRNKSRKNDQV